MNGRDPWQAAATRVPISGASTSSSRATGWIREREKEIGQHIGYRYDVNLVPDYDRLTPFLKKYMELMGWDDLNWLEDVHMGYEEGNAAVFDRNINGWVRVPDDIELPDNQQDRDMIARRAAHQVPDVGTAPAGASCARRT